VTLLEAHSALLDDAPPPVAPEPEPEAAEDVRVPLAQLVRPLLAAALSSSTAGLLVGGIFGSWAARLVGLFAALFGTGWALLVLRSRRAVVVQNLLIPALLLLGIISLIPAGDAGGPSKLPSLVGDAISSGRLLRPPVPFDPGWRPIILMVIGVLAFGTAWLATKLERPKLAIAAPLPIVALTAVSQPDSGEVLAGIVAFVGLLGALSVLYGGDPARASELGRQFELKRAVRAVASGAVMVALLVGLANASFLFPKPVYDPADKPQKPRPVPLSAIEDRVLFEVRTDSGITGPWRTGVLDVYDGESWKLPPFDVNRFESIPSSGVLDPARVATATVSATFVVRDLGDSAVLPDLAGLTSVQIDEPRVVFDPRPAILRMRDGRVPPGLTYTVKVPEYPDAVKLEAAGPPPNTKELKVALEVPKPSAAIRSLLAQAPTNPWKRLEYLRKQLADVVIATGAGQPVDFPPERVDEILTGNHEATPFEIVAADALLARWAGIPSRIGFGFDGLNDEDGALTVRPKNAAQFLEVYFAPYGWVPLSATPPKAKATLDSDPNARFNPTILPSDDIAVEIYLPVELETLRLLYERIREILFRLAPLVAIGIALVLASPSVERTWRRRARRQWAEQIGPRAKVAVEYAELRELMTDLNLGDPYDTALEFLGKVQQDREHTELAWLVTRALYGDLAESLTEEDVRAAREMSWSLRRRVARAQPLQSRFLAAVGRTSLRRPHSSEMPNPRPLAVPVPRLRLPRPASLLRRPS
jgi:hypothetical protein